MASMAPYARPKDLLDATVVCKSLGYAAAMVAMGGAAYSPETGQVCAHVCMVNGIVLAWSVQCQDLHVESV